MIEPLLFAATQISTFQGDSLLTKASGFFFARDERLFLVTSRHVFHDDPTGHAPDRIEFDLHVSEDDLTQVTGFSVPLYKDGERVWRQGEDSGGDIDVAAVEIDRAALPETTVVQAFTPSHLQTTFDDVGIGSPVLIVGFPLGFHDTIHRLAVVRHAVVASSFGVRFQGQGLFLTDGRMHRGTSGAAVVRRAVDSELAGDKLPWKLLGVHSASLDMATRDQIVDETLGLNCAWYATILLPLSEEVVAEEEATAGPTTDS